MFIRRKFLKKSAHDELSDIQDNLNQLLSTRRGTGYFLPHFGVTDTGYRTPSEMAQRLGQEIRENLRLFEPRLSLVEIDEDYQDDGRVILRVNCKVVASGARVQIMMDSRGRLLEVGADGVESLGDDVGTARLGD